MARTKLRDIFSKKAGVYAGTFDPVTRGHLDIIFQAAKLMDTLYVVVGVNSSKQPLFTSTERARMLRREIREHVLPRLRELGINCRIVVKEHEGLTAQFMKDHDAPFYIRGLRRALDFDAEYPAVIASQGEYKELVPVFLCAADPTLENVSSTIARDLARHGGHSLERYVTPRVAKALEQKFRK